MDQDASECELVENCTLLLGELLVAKALLRRAANLFEEEVQGNTLGSWGGLWLVDYRRFIEQESV